MNLLRTLRIFCIWPFAKFWPYWGIRWLVSALESPSEDARTLAYMSLVGLGERHTARLMIMADKSRFICPQRVVNILRILGDTASPDIIRDLQAFKELGNQEIATAATEAIEAIESNHAVNDPVDHLGEEVEAGEKTFGVLVLAAQATLTGNWVIVPMTEYSGEGYLHDNNANKGQMSARFTPVLPSEGHYEVRVSYSPHANRANDVSVTVHSTDGDRTFHVNQQVVPPRPPQTAPLYVGIFHSLGGFHFTPGEDHGVTISNENSVGFVTIDAVHFIPIEN